MKSRPHQRDHESNQQIATATRPQLPRDGSAGMKRWEPGELPMGGYRSTYQFETTGTKKSPTTGGGRKVY